MGFPLPDELISLTLTYLDVPSLLRCMQVSLFLSATRRFTDELVCDLTIQGLQVTPFHHLREHPVGLQNRIVRVLHGG